MLAINDLTFCYPGRKKPVLEDISLEINPGGVYGLLGKNGVGKSTLLYLIAGLLTPRKGNVLFDGVDTRLRRPSTLSELFIVPEMINLPKISLKRFVDINSMFYPRFSMNDLKSHLELFDMPFDINIGRLSMGQAKKVFMAFALATNTRLLLMDEPTNGLDIPSKAAFRRFIASTMNDERSILISTHQVQDINLLLDHVVIMENSGVLLNESVSEIIAKLRFEVTNDPYLASTALYALPSLQGTQIILPNHEGAETEINLETLFGYTVDFPESINTIFIK